MARRNEARKGAPRPRGVVVRSGGALVRRVSSYVTPDTYERLKAKAGETATVSEVVGAAIVAFLGPRRRKARR